MGKIYVAILIVFVLGLVCLAMAGERKARQKGTRTCQCCRKKIAYTANVCPYCGRDPGTDLWAEGRIIMKLVRIAITVCLLLALFVVIACGIAFLLGYEF